MFSPINNVHSFSVMRIQFYGALVCCLLLNCCPSAIVWAVSFIAVNSVDTMFRRWTIANIREEVVKVHPSFTDRYSATAVTMKRNSFFVEAATFHCEPTTISFSSAFVVFRNSVDVQATAAFAFSHSKRVCLDSNVFSAIAETEPSGFYTNMTIAFQDGPSVEFLSC